jgi:hypothetical protein
MTDPKRLLCFLNACRAPNRPASEDIPAELAEAAAGLFAAVDALDAGQLQDQCRVLAHVAFADDVPMPILWQPAALPSWLRVGDVAAAVDAQVTRRAASPEGTVRHG